MRERQKVQLQTWTLKLANHKGDHTVGPKAGTVMSHTPSVEVGKGLGRIAFHGKEPIERYASAMQFYLICRGIALMLVPILPAATYVAVQLWLR